MLSAYTIVIYCHTVELFHYANTFECRVSAISARPKREQRFDGASLSAIVERALSELLAQSDSADTSASARKRP